MSINHHQDVMQNLPNCSLGNFTLRRVNSLTPPLPSSFPNFSKSHFPTLPPMHCPTFPHSPITHSRFPAFQFARFLCRSDFQFFCYAAFALYRFPLSQFPPSQLPRLPTYLLTSSPYTPLRAYTIHPHFPTQPLTPPPLPHSYTLPYKI